MSKDPVLGREFLSLFGQQRSPAGAQVHFREYLFYQARTAMYHGLRALGLLPGDVILLPSFLCAAAIEPVLAYGVKVEFYRIDRDCQTDFADLEKRIHQDLRIRDLQFIAEESRSFRRSFDHGKMGNSSSPHNRPAKARTIG